jgi:mRNA interferase RelE/StbE
MAELFFLDEAITDLEDLDGSARRLVLGKMRLLATNPEAGEPLGSRRTGNLTGFRKLVVGNRTYRVVYRVEQSGDICVIWVIGARDDEACYETTIARLSALGDSPTAKRLADAIQQMRPAAQRQIIKITGGGELGTDGL